MDKVSSADSSGGRPAELTLTKRQVALVLLVFIASLIAVGLLAGLVRPAPRSAVSSVRVSGGDAERPWLNGRLPRHVLPVHYDLSLFPDFYQNDAAKFDGNVSILVNVTSKPTRHLLVHIKALTISRTSVRHHQPSADHQTTPIQVHQLSGPIHSGKFCSK